MLNAHHLDFDTIRPLDLTPGALTPGSTAAPFSTLLWAVVSGDSAAAEAHVLRIFHWETLASSADTGQADVRQPSPRARWHVRASSRVICVTPRTYRPKKES